VQVLIFDTTAGSHNAAACFKSLFQHDYESATHRLASDGSCICRLVSILAGLPSR